MLMLKEFLAAKPRTAVMAIVNATGDSFSEGMDSSPDSAVERGCFAIASGADVLDIGGESTRPGSRTLSVKEEIARVIPVLETLKRLHPEAVYSIDTRHSEVAEAALECGAQIINDVSMLRCSPDMAAVVARYGAGIILNHSRAVPETMQSAVNCQYPGGVARTVAAELAAAREKALAAGIAPGNILLDPGIGFAKTAPQCWELLRDLNELGELGDLVVGVSRKSFLGVLTGGAVPAERGGETLAVELELASRGVGMIRTHAVRELVNAVKAMDYFRRF